MCEFVSFVVTDRSEVRAGTFCSHEDIAAFYGLRCGSYREAEWTQDDHGESLTVRLGPLESDTKQEWWRQAVLSRWGSRQRLIDQLLQQLVVLEPKWDGCVDLNGYTELTTLPEGLRVGGYLGLRDCISLTALPEDLSVGGPLYLNGCTALATLPERLFVGSCLDARGCIGLLALPEGLWVGGYLDLGGCTSLMALPEGLSVRNGLYLEGCTALTALPDDLSLDGALYLEGCTALTALPERLEACAELAARRLQRRAAWPT